jgi:hypothetical protein
MNDDQRAMLVLEKAVMRAKSMLEKTQSFRPFALMLYEDGSIKSIENRVNDIENSYEQLRDSMKIRALEGGVDVLAIVIDTLIPELAFIVINIAYTQNQIIDLEQFYILIATLFLLNISVPLAIKWWKPYYIGEKELKIKGILFSKA